MLIGKIKNRLWSPLFLIVTIVTIVNLNGSLGALLLDKAPGARLGARSPIPISRSSIHVPCCPIISHYCLMGDNLWYFNTATENCPLTDVFHNDARPLIGAIPLPCARHAKLRVRKWQLVSMAPVGAESRFGHGTPGNMDEHIRHGA